MDEKELFEYLTLELSDLIDYIRINKETKKGEATERKYFKTYRSGSSDAVEIVYVHLRNPEKMAEKGVRVSRCDYDYLPKCYCIHFRSH